MLELIDIHNHSLPDIDDGARSIEQSIKMLKIAYDEGYRHIILTPHYKRGRFEASIDQINEKIELLRNEIEKLNIDLKLYAGNELFYTSGCIEKLNEKQINTMAGSNYILVEFMPNTDYSYIKNALNNLIMNGYVPIVAHVERYEEVIKKIANVEELINMGCYIQMNASSLVGNIGWSRKRVIKKLLKKGLVHFIGTDCHSDCNRAPRVKECIKYINKKFGEDYTAQLFYHNPLQVINNEYL